MVVRPVADYLRQKSTSDMEIKLTERATIGEGTSGGAAGVTDEGASGVSRVWQKGEMVEFMRGMFHCPVRVPAFQMEEEVTFPAGVCGAGAKCPAAGALYSNPGLQIQNRQVVLMVEMLILHSFFSESTVFNGSHSELNYL